MTFGRLFSSQGPLAAADSPDGASLVIERTFRAWARSRGHRVTPREVLRIHGRVGGRAVTIDPGLDRGVPGWVTVTVLVALPWAPRLLVTRGSLPVDPIAAAIRVLFDDPVIGPELRAVTVSPRRVRLRLAPGAEPDLVEGAVRAVAHALGTTSP